MLRQQIQCPIQLMKPNILSHHFRIEALLPILEYLEFGARTHKARSGQGKDKPPQINFQFGMRCGDGFQNAVDAALFKQSLQNQKRPQDIGVLHINAFCQFQHAQHFFVFADGGKKFIHAVFTGFAQ